MPKYQKPKKMKEGKNRVTVNPGKENQRVFFKDTPQPSSLGTGMARKAGEALKKKKK